MPYYKIDRVVLPDIKGDGKLTEEEKAFISREWKKRESLWKKRESFLDKILRRFLRGGRKWSN